MTEVKARVKEACSLYPRDSDISLIVMGVERRRSQAAVILECRMKRFGEVPRCERNRRSKVDTDMPASLANCSTERG